MNDTLDIDIGALVSLIGDDPAKHRILLQKYVQTAGDSIAEIRAAREQRDAEPIRRISHRLKSSSRSIGALRLAGVFQSLEEAGKAAHWDQIDRLVAQIDPLYRRVERYIDGYCSQEKQAAG